jgi:hypothetical protein
MLEEKMVNLRRANMKLAIFIVSAVLLVYAAIMYWIMAHAPAPELSSTIAEFAVLGLTGVGYTVVLPAIHVVTEWQISRA